MPKIKVKNVWKNRGLVIANGKSIGPGGLAEVEDLPSIRKLIKDGFLALCKPEKPKPKPEPKPKSKPKVVQPKEAEPKPKVEEEPVKPALESKPKSSKGQSKKGAKK